MSRFYSKIHDGKITLFDFVKTNNTTKPNHAANDCIAFSIHQDNHKITYYFCQKQLDAPVWHFYPIKWVKEKRDTTVPYFIYDPNTEQWVLSLAAVSSDTQPRLNQSHHAYFLTETEENQILTNHRVFHPIIQKIKNMQLDRLSITAGERQNQSFHELLEQCYHHYALNLLSKCLETHNLDEIKKTLATHWEHVKNNLLCYTTLSNDPRYHKLMTLFCETAVSLEKRLNQTKKAHDSVVSAIELLMPNLALESQYPKSFPDLFHPKLNETKEALMRVLQTHIVGNQGQCLIPANLLCNPNNPLISNTETQQAVGAYPKIKIQSTDLQKLINPYFYASDENIMQTGYLERSTCLRLQRFSPYHEALFQIKAEYDSLLHQDQATLLAQLNRLMKDLHQFSAHKGIGKTGAMATGGSLAIIAFFNYYNHLLGFDPTTFQMTNQTILQKIPEAIRKELEALRDPKKKVWCTGILAEQLERLINEHAVVLAQISIDQGQQEKLIEEKHRSFENNQNIIKDQAMYIPNQHQTQSPTQSLSGKDCLGMTKDMLGLLAIENHYHIRTLSDLDNLMQSTPEEIELLSQLPGKSKEIINVLYGQDKQSCLENLQALITTYSDQQIIAFFKANQDVFFSTCIGTDVIMAMWNRTDIFDMMRNSTRDGILNLIVSHAHDLIKTASSLRIFLDYDKLTTEQRTQILNAMSSKLDEMINNANQLFHLLNCDKLTVDHYKQIFLYAKAHDLLQINQWWWVIKFDIPHFEKIRNAASIQSDKNDLESIKNDLKNLIAKYAIKIILDSNDRGCFCNFFHINQKPVLKIKFLAAKEMLREISGSQYAPPILQENLSEEEKQQIQKAKQDGRLKQIQEKIIRLRAQSKAEQQLSTHQNPLSLPAVAHHFTA